MLLPSVLITLLTCYSFMSHQLVISHFLKSVVMNSSGLEIRWPAQHLGVVFCAPRFTVKPEIEGWTCSGTEDMCPPSKVIWLGPYSAPDLLQSITPSSFTLGPGIQLREKKEENLEEEDMWVFCLLICLNPEMLKGKWEVGLMSAYKGFSCTWVGTSYHY